MAPLMLVTTHLVLLLVGAMLLKKAKNFKSDLDEICSLSKICINYNEV